MLDVMGIHVMRIAASGESAAAIACVERAAKRGRNATCLASDVERLALSVLQDAYNAGVAGQATGGLCRKRWTLLELAASRDAVSKRLGVHVHDDLLTVSSVQRLRPVL